MKKFSATHSKNSLEIGLRQSSYNKIDEFIELYRKTDPYHMMEELNVGSFFNALNSYKCYKNEEFWEHYPELWKIFEHKLNDLSKRLKIDANYMDLRDRIDTLCKLAEFMSNLQIYSSKNNSNTIKNLLECIKLEQRLVKVNNIECGILKASSLFSCLFRSFSVNLEFSQFSRHLDNYIRYVEEFRKNHEFNPTEMKILGDLYRKQGNALLAQKLLCGGDNEKFDDVERAYTRSIADINEIYSGYSPESLKSSKLAMKNAPILCANWGDGLLNDYYYSMGLCNCYSGNFLRAQYFLSNVRKNSDDAIGNESHPYSSAMFILCYAKIKTAQSPGDVEDVKKEFINEKNKKHIENLTPKTDLNALGKVLREIMRQSSFQDVYRGESSDYSQISGKIESKIFRVLKDNYDVGEINNSLIIRKEKEFYPGYAINANSLKSIKHINKESPVLYNVADDNDKYKGVVNLIDFSSSLLASVHFATGKDDEHGFVYITPKPPVKRLLVVDNVVFDSYVLESDDKTAMSVVEQRAHNQASLLIRSHEGFLDINDGNIKYVKIDKKDKILINMTYDGILGITRYDYFNSPNDSIAEIKSSKKLKPIFVEMFDRMKRRNLYNSLNVNWER